MGGKLRQITDTIHKTVYLSEFESEMMSTAYFYRLHDVYQSSTVYLTFPCNRTKRYEHSYGTMELAGEMFFSAITNASAPVLMDFFRDAEMYLTHVTHRLLEGSIQPTYCRSSYSGLSKCFTQVMGADVSAASQKSMDSAFRNYEQIEEVALNHYMPPFTTDFPKRKFLYQCLLEAVRIAALFHDVGHPPYSHIMENVLDQLYQKCSNPTEEINKTRARDLVRSLQPFKDENDNIQCLLSNPHEGKSALHEQVGLKMLAGAFEDIFASKFAHITVTGTSRSKLCAVAVYYVAVAEFCFAILRDENPFFVALHRIIDGTVDADRMDYIVRDTRNSGVDWGSIPYKRLLESCKLTKLQQGDNYRYCVAFPKKMTEHIDDLLITRYKIFSRINYHHRSYKTALILQRIVKVLAEDYLCKRSNEKALCPGISDLWNCLSSTMNSGDLYIIQWNDSTLTSHLYKTLAEVKNASPDDYLISDEKYTDILNMLEEFLLNRKHYYSVFKRQSDQALIFTNVFDRLQPHTAKIISHEIEKLNRSEDRTSFEEADDSLKRMNAATLNAAVETGDADALERLFPTKATLGTIIQNVLQEYKASGTISAYLFDNNTQRGKTGLPRKDDQTDTIYLYQSESEDAESYDVTILHEQLVQLQNHCLQYIAYIEPVGNADTVIASLRREISDRFYVEVENAMKEMFSCLNS